MAGKTGVLPWWGERWHTPLFVVFLLGWVAAIAPTGHDLTGVFLAIALASTLATLGRQLPLQNVVVIAVVFGCGSAAVTVPVARVLDWRLVILWTAVLLNARGAGQFLLRRWRTRGFYGWGVTLTAGALSGIFGALLYNSASASLFCGLTSVGLLVMTLPFFLNKRPAEPPVSYQPLIVLPALLSWVWLR